MSAASGPAARLCATCGAIVESAVACDACGCVFDVEGVDAFSLLGLPRSFDLDIDDLRKRYLTLSRRVHPDRAPQGAAQQRLAQRASALLNQSFRALTDPLSRAEALLELAGGPSAAIEKSVEPDVLAETLEIREAIDEAAAARDMTALDAIEARVRGEFDRRREHLAIKARELPADESIRRALRVELNSIKYYQRMLESVKSARSADGS